MDKRAQSGIVTIQERRISLIRWRFKALIPRAIPTPKTAPTRAWGVETGRPSFEAIKMVVAAPNSAAKPRVGVSSVIFLPIVSMTRQPHVDRPITMPAPPRAKSQEGIGEWEPTVFVRKTSKIAATGPMAFATSLAP